MTHLSPQQLSAHLDSALHGASLQAVESHLEVCEKCRDELAALTLQDQLLGDALRGDTDRELFDLIGLRVQSDVHPQRARALEKSIAELERTRDERRRHAQAVARQVQEQRQQPPDIDEAPRGLPVPAAPSGFEPTRAPVDPPAAADPGLNASSSADPRRRALDEARARAETEARAFALESERARAEAESRVLEQAAARARHQAAARRRAEENSRTRTAASARADAERLARDAEAAQQAAEISARDALAAQSRAETRAVAAEEAQRQARRKADEARRLETELAAASGSGTRAKAPRPLDARQPAMLGSAEVDAVRDRNSGQEFTAELERPARPRRSTSRARRTASRSTVLTLAASLLILLAAVWFAIGRQFVRLPGQELPATPAVETPAGDAGAALTPAPRPASESAAPAAPAPTSQEGHKPRHAAAPEGAHHTETAAEETSGEGAAASQEEAQLESEDEPVDLGLLCGTVRDNEKRPIAGARVVMADVDVVVVTDRVGRFCLTAPRGARALSVIAPGFATYRRTVNVGQRTGEVSLTLQPSATSPQRRQ